MLAEEQEYHHRKFDELRRYTWRTVVTLDTSLSDVLRRADAALYKAKAGGRNRVER